MSKKADAPENIITPQDSDEEEQHHVSHKVTSFMQKFLPAIVLFAVLAVIIITFTVSGRNAELTEIEEALVNTVALNAERTEHNFKTMLTATQIAADAIPDREIAPGDPEVINILRSIKDASVTEHVIYVGPGMVAFDESGTPVDMDAQKLDSIVRSTSAYAYTTGYEGVDSVIAHCEIPGPEGDDSDSGEEGAYGHLLSFLNPKETFAKNIRNMHLGDDSFFILMTKDGYVLADSGAQTPLRTEGSEDYISYLKGIVPETSKVDRMYTRMQSETQDIIMVPDPANPKKNYGLAYAPVGSSGMYLVAGASPAYFARNLKWHWQKSRNAIIEIVIALLAFIVSVVVINAISSQHTDEKTKEYSVKAETDPLTGLLNKGATEKHIRDYIDKNPTRAGMLFLFDIDNFKKINDTRGHQFGDEVLRTIGSRLPAEFRATDIVGRIGGDEFMVFLCGIKDTDEIIRTEGRRIESFFQGFQVGDYVKYAVTASIGAAVYTRDGATFDDLYKSADHALYVAKRRGKNQLAYYGDEGGN